MVHNYRTTQTTPISASIVGARGYAGLELAKLLLKHPEVKLTHAFATQKFSLNDELMDPRAAHVTCLTDDQVMQNLTDVVFLATPAEASMHLAPQILKAGKKVIDLSGAFRLKKNDFKNWYGFDHTEAELTKTAEYGLAPFCGPSKSALIANPGCYATAVSMALIPLLKRDLIETEGLVIDAKSGTTGAGRKAGENLLFSEVDGECLPYRVGRHQHFPEFVEAIETHAKAKVAPHFATHLLAAKRGIIASIYATTKTTNVADILNAFTEEYAHYPLARVGHNVAQLAKLSHVVGTPYTHISFELTQNKLYLFSTIDNLLKGAASQAVENLNRMLDLPLTHTLHQEA